MNAAPDTEIRLFEAVGKPRMETQPWKLMGNFCAEALVRQMSTEMDDFIDSRQNCQLVTLPFPSSVMAANDA